jgi:hypothetical protein
MRSAARLGILARPRSTPRSRHRVTPRVEQLEARNLLSIFTPTQIRTAYGFNAAAVSSLDGTGQTIAIVDAFDHPNAASDLSVFSNQFGISAANLIKVGLDASGNPSTTSFPAFDAGWSEEIALDIEWAHAIAPKANILLVEANSNSYTDLLNAVDYARNYTSQFGGSPVSVVSMSWGGGEFSGITSLDTHFTTPTGHQGVTFVASSGDNGAWYGVEWPSSSPNVVSVGGTSLTVANSAGTYRSETGWGGSGGGYSSFESEPPYQTSVQSSGVRTNPDIAYDANPNTGYYVYVSTASPPGWYQFGGTSAGSPQVAGLVALADQSRVQTNPTAGTLDGASQVLPTLYSMPSTDFHDVTRGSNGYSAHTGYDLVTGRGSPKADLVIPALASTTRTAAAAARPASGGTSGGSASGHSSSGVTQAPTSTTSGFTAVPFILAASTPTTAALTLANLSPVPGARLFVSAPAAVPTSTILLVPLPETRPVDRWVSVVGAEDPVVEERGDGASGTGVRPAAGQPDGAGTGEVAPGLGQGLGSGNEGVAVPGMVEEVSEGTLAAEAGVTARPASALAVLFLALSGSWAFHPEDLEETRRARVKPDPRSRR